MRYCIGLLTNQNECLVAEILHHGNRLVQDQVIALELGTVMRGVHHLPLGPPLAHTPWEQGGAEGQGREREGVRKREGERVGRRD